MPRVKIGPALPDPKAIDVEIARLRDLDITQLRGLGTHCWDAERIHSFPATSCFAFWPIGCRPTTWATWTAKANACSTSRRLPRMPVIVPRHWLAAWSTCGRARSWDASGTGRGTPAQSGNDTLTGGGGAADTFHFGPFFGNDTVTDFRPGTDKLEIDNTMFADFNTVMAHAAQSGADTVITYDGHDTITLKGVTVGSLHNGDFLFV